VADAGLRRRTARWLALLGLAVAGSASGHPDAERDLLFALDFDDGSTAPAHAAESTQRVDGPARLDSRVVKGRRGGAAYLRRPGETLGFDARGNLRPDEGTLSLWVQPRNWEGAAKGASNFKHFVTFLTQTRAGPLMFFLYKERNSPTLAFHVSTGPHEANWLSRAPAEALGRGNWHKLDATWSGESLALYVDGQLLQMAQLPPEFAARAASPLRNGRIEISPLRWTPSSWEDETAIDSVRVLGRALPAAEVERRYRRDLGEATSGDERASAELFGLDLDDGRIDRVRARVDAGGLSAEWQQAFETGAVTAAARLQKAGKVLASHSLVPRTPRFQLDLDGANAGGAYQLEVELRRAGEDEPISVAARAERPSTDWFGSGVGLEDQVPSPWTAVELDGERVRLWNREYLFDGPFLRQVRSEGQELLSEPVRLYADAGDGERPVTFSPPHPVEVRKDSVTFEGTGSLGKLRFHYRNQVWFDGYHRVELGVGPQGVELRRLVLRYALPVAHARYLLTPTWQPFKPGGNGFDWSERQGLRGFSLLWLLGERHGFAWVPEHEGNWVGGRRGAPIQVARDGDRVRAEIQLIGRQVELPAGVSYPLGFIATPSRPLPGNHRSFATEGSRPRHGDARTIGWRGVAFSSYASLEPDESDGPDRYDRHIRELAKQGRKLFPYSSPVGLSDIEPVVKWFHRSWEIPGLVTFPIEDPSGLRYHQISLSPTRAFRDFFAAKLDRYLGRGEDAIGGPYFDLVTVVRNPGTGPGGRFVDAFGREVPFQLTTSGLRELLLRSVRIARRYGKLTWYHGHNLYNPAVQGLGDFWYPGEQYVEAFRKNPYYLSDGVHQEVFASEFASASKGVGVIFLPTLGRDAPERLKDPDLTEAMLTRLLLNDVPVSATQCHEGTIDRIWGIWKRFALDDAEFVRFDQNREIRSSDPSVVVSYYRLSDGSVLAVVGNLSSTDRSVRLELPGYRKVRDLWRQQNLKLAEQGLGLRLAARRFAILRLRP